MKRSTFILFSLAIIFANTSFAQATANKTRKQNANSATTSVAYPYTATYSSDFSIGNPDNAALVLALYKDFENQDWSKDSWFHDTVVAINTDGKILRGKDQVLETFRNIRESLSSASFKMSAIIPLKSNDKNEDWVAVWGVQSITPKDSNEATNFEYQAIWRIDENKKVNFIRFFEARMRH